ncbi:prevent-host-death family protein [Actinomyces sp. Z5]|uniref:type II toxin-antitoxin system Phd/YefM family antitoxin n=1 Tax=Actinomyces sp. Z5 TaxID=2250216 RepID=UPI000DCE6C69|nr:type II toxin-antitoxin system prevent-host-death family antitoxin [Actinomyces sp. Z5]RAX20246.1 prevent-host-death family protein [Actinomyces sp. Z5]
MVTVEPPIERLSQRELRNESARVLREVGEGRSFVITNSGVPVARIVPLSELTPALPVTRPARRRGGWAKLGIERRESSQDFLQSLDDLRSDRG